MKQLGHHKTGHSKLIGLCCTRAAAKDVLELHFSSRLTPAVSCGLRSYWPGVSEVQAFIQLLTQLVSCPPYLLFWGEKKLLSVLAVWRDVEKRDSWRGSSWFSP